MIDLSSVKEAYKNGEANDIVFIRSEYNPADALTKIMKSNILENILKTARIDHPIEQYIHRDEKS